MDSLRNGSTEPNGDTDLDVQIYVKAGVNGRSYGACPYCQSAVMMLIAKVN